jgi:hypothetical protein
MDPSVLSTSKLFDVPEGVLDSVRVGDLGESLAEEVDKAAEMGELLRPVTASEMARNPIARWTLGETPFRLDVGEDFAELSPFCLDWNGMKVEAVLDGNFASSSRFVTEGECDSSSIISKGPGFCDR